AQSLRLGRLTQSVRPKQDTPIASGRTAPRQRLRRGREIAIQQGRHVLLLIRPKHHDRRTQREYRRDGERQDAAATNDEVRRGSLVSTRLPRRCQDGQRAFARQPERQPRNEFKKEEVPGVEL